MRADGRIHRAGRECRGRHHCLLASFCWKCYNWVKQQSKDALFLHIIISLAVNDISFCVFKFLLDIRSKLCQLSLTKQFLMESQCVIYCCHIFKVNCIRNPQAFHTICVSPLLEMHFEGPSTPITIVSADFTFVLHSQAMQFIQPIGNRLPIPTQRKVLGVVHWFIRIHLTLRLYLIIIGLILFLVASRLLLPDQIHRIIQHSSQLLSVPTDQILQFRHLFHLFLMLDFELLFGFLFFLVMVLVELNSLRLRLINHFGSFLGRLQMLFSVHMIDVCPFAQKQLSTVNAINCFFIRKFMFFPSRNYSFGIFFFEIRVEFCNKLSDIHQRADLLQETIQILNQVMEISLQLGHILHFIYNRNRLEFIKVLQIPKIISELVLLLSIEGFKDVQILHIECVHIYMFTSSFLCTKRGLFFRGTEHNFIDIVHGIYRQIRHWSKLLMHILQFLNSFIKVEPNAWRSALITLVDVSQSTNNLHFLLPHRIFFLKLPQGLVGSLLDHLHKDADFRINQYTFFGVLHFLEHEFDYCSLECFDALHWKPCLLQPTAVHVVVLVYNLILNLRQRMYQNHFRNSVVFIRPMSFGHLISSGWYKWVGSLQVIFVLRYLNYLLLGFLTTFLYLLSDTSKSMVSFTPRLALCCQIQQNYAE